MKGGEVVAGRFEIRALAGTGGMGQVFRGLDRMTGHPVAVKVLRSEGEDEIERFVRESLVLAELRHPAIVEYVAHGETLSGDLFLVMEWLEGEDLQKVLTRGRLALEDCVTLGRRIAEALAAAHTRGIVHRDLKPANVFLEDRKIDRARVLDFGLARLVDSARGLTRTGIALGTPGYMSPEQASAEGDVGVRSDLFSLGCILYECITGHAVFRGDRVAAVLLKVLHEKPMRIRFLRPEVPKELDDLIARLLAKDAARRPESAEAVVEELSRIVIDRTVPGNAPSERPQRASLTRGEQRLTSFIVVLPKNDAGVTWDPASPPAVEAAAGVREVAIAFGGQAEVVADGSVVVTLTTNGAATDLAAQAARCALAARARLDGAAIAVTIGRRDTGMVSSVSDAVERATGLLAEGTTRGAEGAHPVRVDEVTAGLLDPRFDVRGDDRSLLLYRERPSLEGPRTLLGKATPFVGRERELASLVSLLEESVREPVARVVLVTGPAGHGKTRLAHELLRAASERPLGLEVLRGHGYPGSAGDPFSVLRTVVRGAAGIADGEAIDVQRMKIRGRVARHVAADEVERVADFLGEIAGVPESPDESAALRVARRAPPLMADNVRRAWLDFMAAETGTGPVLLVLEDLTWGDPPSVKYVDLALRQLSGAPLMVLATARPNVTDLFPRIWADRGVLEMRLGPLTPRASERLARAVLGEHATPAELGAVVDAAQGNAFFLEELLRARAQGDASSLPPTLLAVLQARLERLDPGARRVLRAASVFGSRATETGIHALLSEREDDADLGRWLTHLVDEELLERSIDGAPGGAAFVFRHALVREAAYATLTDEDRRLGHRLAAEWLEAGPPGPPLVFAHHWEQGGEPEKAAALLAVASDEAFHASDVTGALLHAERAVALGAKGEVLGLVLCVEAQARIARLEVDAAARAAEQALELLPQASLRWCFAVGVMASVALFSRRPDLLHAVEAQVLAYVPTPETTVDLVATLSILTLMEDRLGEHARARTLLQRAEALEPEDAPENIHVRARVALAQAYHAGFALADPWAQLRAAERSRDGLARIGDRATEAYASVQVAMAYATMGAYAEAERAIGPVFEDAERSQMVVLLALAGYVLGLARAGMGLHAAGRAIVERAVERARAAKVRHLESGALCALARVHLFEEDFAGAEREASKVAKEPPSTADEVDALGILATARLRLGKIDAALTAARAAQAFLDERGGVGHADALVRLAHVEALRASGDLAGARASLAIATARVRARADSIASPALRASFLEVSEVARTLAMRIPSSRQPASSRTGS